MSLTPKLLQQGAAGSARANYIEEVFSTFLYTGNSGTQTITNDIDLAGKGGLVWRKGRSAATSHGLIDTQRGIASLLNTNTQSAAVTGTNWIDSFNSNGFTMNVNSFNGGATYASWTFRKQPKFFDIVTYTGNGGTQTVSHSLGSKPGFILCKATSTTSDWAVWHRGNGTTGYSEFSLNSNSAASATSDSTISTTTNFKPSAIFDATVTAPNTNGVTYVAYLFAHNAGGFGLTGNDNVISCGSYTGTGAAGNAITLGYEPQWLMIKRTDASNEWHMQDVMRGSPVSGTVPSGGSNILYANQASAEFGSGSNPEAFPTATGFTLQQNTTSVNASGGTYIYIAIRRGPMKVPTTGTSVFKPVVYTGNGGTQSITSDFPVDLAMTDNRTRTSSGSTDVKDRMRGYRRHLGTNGAGFNYEEQDDSGGFGFVFFDRSTNVGMDAGPRTNDSGVSYVTRLFRRAPSFFDEVCYTNTGSSQQVAFTTLGTTPEIVIYKARGTTSDWYVLAKVGSVYHGLKLNTTAASAFNDTAANLGITSTYFDPVFGWGGPSSFTYVAYFFASCPGVSKVGSYTGNGSSQTINCGFAAGARFVLIKRTDSTGDWYTFDTARGIITGNDPFLKFNTTDAEVTAYDAVDPDSSGFIVNNDATNFPINVASATYIFLAIA